MAYQAFIDYNRKFGVEIECVGESPVQTLDLFYDLQDSGLDVEISKDILHNPYRWSIAQDSTLVGKEPIELITPALFFNPDGLFKVNQGLRNLVHHKFEINDSCGLHVHWGASDFTGEHVLNLLRLYAKYEKVIDLFLDPSRRENRNKNCQSLIKHGGFEWIGSLQKPLYLQAFQIANEFQRTQKIESADSLPSARHHKVNVTSINKYETIEFRQHQGTLNYFDVYYWILFTGQMINRAKTSCFNVRPGKATFGSLMKVLGLTNEQMQKDTAEYNLLSQMREHYKKIYKENNK